MTGARFCAILPHRTNTAKVPPMKYPPLELVSVEFEEAPRARPVRGVFEDSVAPADERWWTLVASSGKVGIVHLPAELVDADFERRLCQWFESHDVRRLRAI